MAVTTLGGWTYPGTEKDVTLPACRLCKYEHGTVDCPVEDKRWGNQAWIPLGLECLHQLKLDLNPAFRLAL